MTDVDDKPPFDATRAAFFLIAGVIAVQCAVVLIGVVFCLSEAAALVEGKIKCDPEGRLYELLTGALAAALAFAVGHNRKP